MEPQKPNLPPMTILLVIGIVIVVILILFTSYYQTSERRRAAAMPVTPTPIRDDRGRILSPTPNPYPPLSKKEIDRNKASELVLKQQRVITPQERQLILALKAEMPVITEDYEIGYSDYLNKFFVYRKTPNAQVRIEEYFSSKNIIDVLNTFPILIQYVNGPVQQEIQKAEDELMTRRLSAKRLNIRGVSTVNAQAPAPRPINTDGTIPDQGDTKIFTDFLVDMLKGVPDDTDVDLSKFGPGKGNPPSGGGTPGSYTGAGNLPATGDLAKILNEAAAKIGTPAKILQAVMRHECGRLLDPGFTTDAQITLWATPGNGLPTDHYCFENDGGDQGPMQFNKHAGSFTSYGSAVNEWGGYTHTPYVENVRDAIYAAALKLRAESDNAIPGGQWTQEQVKHAVICYNAGCGRIGNPPASTQQYADEVWAEYIAN